MQSAQLLIQSFIFQPAVENFNCARTFFAMFFKDIRNVLLKIDAMAIKAYITW